MDKVKNQFDKVLDELNKLGSRIVGSNILGSPYDFWKRYDIWEAAVKNLKKAIGEMEKDGHTEMILKEIDKTIERYRENPNFEEVDICYGMNQAKKIILKHMPNTDQQGKMR